jgi:16S rRNA (guanine966-N2)-methyltransferase
MATALRARHSRLKMRVIAGKFGSRPLASLKGLALRPTSDRLRETLFNILGAAVEGSVFVDVYAGTGAVGIEALSRGAARVYFIEKHRAGVALIHKNLKSLEAGRNTEVLAMDAVRGLEVLQARGVRASFVFLDPPYEDTREYTRTLEFLASSELLEEHARVIVESRRSGKLRAAFPEHIGNLEKTRTIEQGDATLSFYVVA